MKEEIKKKLDLCNGYIDDQTKIRILVEVIKELINELENEKQI